MNEEPKEEAILADLHVGKPKECVLNIEDKSGPPATIDNSSTPKSNTASDRKAKDKSPQENLQRQLNPNQSPLGVRTSNDKTSIKDFLVLPPSSIFSKTPSKDELLTWSSHRLKYPLTQIDKPLYKPVLKCFRDIQRVMGDRNYGAKKRPLGDKPRSLDYETIQRNLELGLSNPSVRGELYLQVLKQLTKNPKSKSSTRGWEILCAYSMAFPPPKNLIPIYLEELSQFHVEMSPEEEKNISAMAGEITDEDTQRKRNSLAASYVRSRLEKLAKTGPRGHLPTTDEIEYTFGAPFRSQVFGGTLSEIMEDPSNRDETNLYPRILTFLAESILLLKGTSQEGIFRVPGFIDEVQMLRLRIEKGEYNIDGIHDPSTPASLLKFWLRELAEPVVPYEFYERCLKVGNNVELAMSILDELPELNTNVLRYIVKFLQVVGNPKYQPITKMTVSNLAMVFAPNVLRCPSDNPLVILANSKLEQNFLKTLINYLEE